MFYCIYKHNYNIARLYIVFLKRHILFMKTNVSNKYIFKHTFPCGVYMFFVSPTLQRFAF